MTCFFLFSLYSPNRLIFIVPFPTLLGTPLIRWHHQPYLFFWDKVERANYFLNAYIETAKRKEPIDGRLAAFLLANPAEDGGQWAMLVNLVEKYGVIPKHAMPESASTEASRR